MVQRLQSEGLFQSNRLVDYVIPLPEQKTVHGDILRRQHGTIGVMITGFQRILQKRRYRKDGLRLHVWMISYMSGSLGIMVVRDICTGQIILQMKFLQKWETSYH